MNIIVSELKRSTGQNLKQKKSGPKSLTGLACRLAMKNVHRHIFVELWQSLETQIRIDFRIRGDMVEMESIQA